MLRGLSVSVEINGDLILDTADIMMVSGVHCTVTVTSVFTVSGSVAVQFRVCEVPSYSRPLGTLRATAGVDTVSCIQMHVGKYFMTQTVETALTADRDRDSLRFGGDVISCSR